MDIGLASWKLISKGIKALDISSDILKESRLALKVAEEVPEAMAAISKVERITQAGEDVVRAIVKEADVPESIAKSVLEKQATNLAGDGIETGIKRLAGEEAQGSARLLEEGIEKAGSIRSNVLNNIADSKVAREASNFSKFESLSNVEARKWYLKQESKIPNMLNKSTSLEQQAMQAVSIRNNFRTQTRGLMAERELARILNNSEPNMSWSQVVKKYSAEGFTGDELYSEIINASQRSRIITNQLLGLK